MWEYGQIYLWPTFQYGNMGKSMYVLPLNVEIWADLFMAYLSIWEYGKIYLCATVQYGNMGNSITNVCPTFKYGNVCREKGDNSFLLVVAQLELNEYGRNTQDD